MEKSLIEHDYEELKNSIGRSPSVLKIEDNEKYTLYGIRLKDSNMELKGDILKKLFEFTFNFDYLLYSINLIKDNKKNGCIEIRIIKNKG